MFVFSAINEREEKSKREERRGEQGRPGEMTAGEIRGEEGKEEEEE